LPLVPVVIIIAGLAALLVTTRAYRRSTPTTLQRLDDLPAVLQQARLRLGRGETFSQSAAVEARDALDALSSALPASRDAGEGERQGRRRRPA
jgi:hypothetical protein